MYSFVDSNVTSEEANRPVKLRAFLSPSSHRNHGKIRRCRFHSRTFSHRDRGKDTTSLVTLVKIHPNVSPPPIHSPIAPGAIAPARRRFVQPRDSASLCSLPRQSHEPRQIVDAIRKRLAATLLAKLSRNCRDDFSVQRRDGTVNDESRPGFALNSPRSGVTPASRPPDLRAPAAGTHDAKSLENTLHGRWTRILRAVSGPAKQRMYTAATRRCLQPTELTPDNCIPTVCRVTTQTKRIRDQPGRSGRARTCVCDRRGSLLGDEARRVGDNRPVRFAIDSGIN